jgi:hypothetical protein
MSALVSLILFFLWRNGEPINWIGWTFKNAWKEIGLGIGLCIPFFIAAGFLERALQVVGLSVPSTPLPSMAAKGTVELFLAIVLVSPSGVVETPRLQAKRNFEKWSDSCPSLTPDSFSD